MLYAPDIVIYSFGQTGKKNDDCKVRTVYIVPRGIKLFRPYCCTTNVAGTIGADVETYGGDM
jgi:hypothetical protein